MTVLAGLLMIAAWCFFWPDGSLIGGILVSIWSWLTPTPWLHDHIGPRVVEQGMNAAVFVPLTACLVLAFPHFRIWVWWILSALCSCSIELFQLLFLPGRVFDPVDAVFNSIGGILGSILGLMLLRRILRARARGDSRRAPVLGGRRRRVPGNGFRAASRSHRAQETREVRCGIPGLPGSRGRPHN
ncbi:VanZ family protein [Rothia sp. HC945]|uniref:VanZ family protein n=1 Tax=Rothia sp. HC945 TaxID=3171170 RepID=UPI003F28E891